LAFGRTEEAVPAEGTAPEWCRTGSLTSDPEPELGHDSSTNALIRRYRDLKR
jgi:hypothetical protein